MAKKRLFEILDDMNVHDTNHNTRLVSVSGNFVEGRKVSQGALVTMGVPYEELQGVLDNTRMPVLLMVDKKEYNARNSE